MEVAVIPPFSLLEEMETKRYHLVLAHLLRHTKYRDFYKSVSGYKIIDNGASEQSLTSPRDLFLAAELVGAQEIIVPDVIGDTKRSIRHARNFSKMADKHPEYKYMGVVQGKNIADHLKSMRALALLDYITVLGIPRHMQRIHRNQRYTFAEMLPKWDLQERFPEVHCLGSTSWTREVNLLTELPWIRGIDTSMPIVLGLLDIRLSDSTAYFARPMGYFTIEANEGQREVAKDNVRTFCGWASAPAGTL